jgi:mitochondrial fission protein ELM1
MKNLQSISCHIVTEGLKGTENQCVGVAEGLSVPFMVKQIELRQPWKFLSPWLRLEQGWSFSPKLVGPWPDLLIVSGRKSIAAARYIKRRNPDCLTVFIQDPRIDPSEFDLVIAPQHDDVKGDNVFKTVAAPNRITPDKLHEAAAQFPELAAMKGSRVAILIGGNSRSHRLTSDMCLRLAKQLKMLSGSLMITVSRRTGADNERILRKALQGENVFFWDGQDENPYFAMLGLADIIMVTSDSASMLSEAATTGKPVYAIPLEGGSRRLDAMLQNLIDLGAVRRFEGTTETWSYTPLNDAKIAADAIRQRLYKRLA